jgi:hypothetical protein
MAMWLGLGALCALLAFGFAMRRANELFVLEQRGVGLSVLRGRIPPALFSALCEIAEREPLGEATLRVVSESGTPRLSVHGAARPALEQAARNVLGSYSVSQIRNGRLKAR